MLAILVNLLYFFATGIVFAVLVASYPKFYTYRKIIVPFGFVVTFCIVAFLIIKEPWVTGLPLILFFLGNYFSYCVIKLINTRRNRKSKGT